MAVGFEVVEKGVNRNEGGIKGGCEVCGSAAVWCAGSKQERAQLSNGPAGIDGDDVVIGGSRVLGSARCL